ncbi:MAG: hypothetical protein F6K16_19320 [Symploca sp. SIO2B6]|nr:hypothetical protein [Symploca sp. SIO2B6]
MSDQISNLAGNHVIQFGSIEQVSSQSTSSGILQVQIGSLAGSLIKITAPEQKTNLPQPHSLPIELAPPSLPMLLGRAEEMQVTLEALAHHQLVEFYGAFGIGKTVLMQQLAHHPSIATSFPDGIVYPPSKSYQCVSDLLQFLWGAFYSCSVAFKPTETQIIQALQDKKALVLLDSVQLKLEELKALRQQLPSFSFLLASVERQLWGEGHSIELSGLPSDEALSLIAHELEHPLSPQEYLEGLQLCTALEGNPLYLLQAVALVKEDNLLLGTVAQQAESSASLQAWTQQLLAWSEKPHRLILALLAAVDGLSLGGQHLSALTGLQEVESVLETLVNRHLVQSVDSRYQISSNLVEDLQQRWKLTPFREQILNYFAGWTQQQQGEPQHLWEESPIILQILEWGVQVGRWSQVLRLGRAIEGALALGGQWGAWAVVLESVLQAARALGNQEIQAWAFHQLGTRAMCLEDTTEARDYLRQALYIRQELLNDQVGTQATTRHLQLLEQPTLEPETVIQQEKLETPTNNRVTLLWKSTMIVVFLALGGVPWLIHLLWPNQNAENPSLSQSESTTLTQSESSSTNQLVTSNPSPSQLISSIPSKIIVSKESELPNPGQPESPSSQQSELPSPSPLESPSSRKSELVVSSRESEIPNSSQPESPSSRKLEPVNSTEPKIPNSKESQTTNSSQPENLNSPESVTPNPTEFDQTNSPESVTPNPTEFDQTNSPESVTPNPTEFDQTNSPESVTPNPTEFDQTNSPESVTPSPTEFDQTNSPELENPISSEPEIPNTNLPATPIPKLTSLSLAQSRALLGTTIEGMLTLSNPAPDGGVVVNLKSDDMFLAKVPPKITLAPGETTATFEFSIPSPEENSDYLFLDVTSVEIKAYLEGESPQKTQLSVYYPN